MNESMKTMKYDLEERTDKFGVMIIMLCKGIGRGTINDVLVKQIVRSATSVGANYCEANGASSQKDFKNKIHICKKEIQETKHWLKMLEAAAPKKQSEIQKCWQEAQELTLIFQKILSTLKKKIENSGLKT